MNQGSFGDSFENMKEGAAQIGTAVADAASAVVTSVGTAASDAKVAVENRLPLADSVVYATTLQAGGILWTQDNDFDGLPDVRYYPKKPG